MDIGGKVTKEDWKSMKVDREEETQRTDGKRDVKVMGIMEE